MRLKSTILITIGILVLSVAVCPAEAGKVDLRLRLKKGDSHEMKMVQTQNIMQSMNEAQMNMTQSQEMVIGMDCLGVDANGMMDVEVTYKSMKMTMDGPMGHIEIDSGNLKPVDSNNPAAQMMAGMFSAIAGTKLQMKVSPTGQTSDIQGLEKMFNKIQEKAGLQSQMAKEFAEQMFGEEQMKQMSGNMFGVFPGKPVDIGDTWDDTLDLDVGFPMDVKTTYTLKDVKKGSAYIDAIAKMEMGDTAKPIDMGPTKASFQMSGTMSMASLVNEKTGLTEKSNMTMNFEGVTKMEANEYMPQGMTMPMKITGEATVELIK
ncbi:MAG: hypothetical protein JW806_09270 [Sedimentisphaerales bacterium]|nr:hypothetical protein [Sedimentisphaerales bacterium]